MIKIEYEDFVRLSEKESNEWYCKVYELGEKGDVEGVTNLFSQANELYLDEYHIYNTIQQLTNDEAFANPDTKKSLLIQLKACRLVKKIKTFKDGTIIIVTKKNIPNIAITRLSDLISEFKQDKDLGNWERHGQCHTKSRDISLKLCIPNEVVTGYFYAMSDKAKFLHTWVEFSSDGQDYVIDYTMNVVMNKSGYYFIKHIEELCRISAADILLDLDLFSNIKDLDIKEYLVFRHEMARELQKNTATFDSQLKKVNNLK